MAVGRMACSLRGREPPRARLRPRGAAEGSAMSETYLEKRTCAYCNGERTIKCERCRGRGGRWAYRLRPTSFGYQTMAMRSEWVGDLFQLPRQPPRAMLALPVARSSICWMGKKRDTMRSRCERRRAP